MRAPDLAPPLPLSPSDRLRDAAERLGAHVDDVRDVCGMLVHPLNSPTHSSLSGSDHEQRLFDTDSINNALDDILLKVCERAFTDSAQSPDPFSFHSSLSSESPPYTHSAGRQFDYSTPSSGDSSPAPRNAHTNGDLDHRRRSSKMDIDSKGDSDHDVPSNNISRIARPAYAKEDLQRAGESAFNRRAPLQPQTPLQALIAFAQRQGASPISVASLRDKIVHKNTTSMAIIPGCDNFSHCCLIEYLQVLFKTHIELVCGILDSNAVETIANIDDLECDISDEAWNNKISSSSWSESSRETVKRDHPPMLRKTIDLFQFTNRLVEKMSRTSDDTAQIFIERLYASEIPVYVASLTTLLLCKWGSVSGSHEPARKKSLLIEWCIRVLVDFIVYELSPVSQIKQTDNLSEQAFMISHLGKEQLPPLSKVVECCFDYVSSSKTDAGRDCRLSVSELVQTYVIRCACPPKQGSLQAKGWEQTEGGDSEFLSRLFESELFWSLVVHTVAQRTMKISDPSDVSFEYAFLACLMGQSAAIRAIFDDSQSRARSSMLDLLIKNLEFMARDPLSSFLLADEQKKVFPGILTSVDFVQGLMSSATVQREILSSDYATKDLYLQAMEGLITNSAGLITCSLDMDRSLEHAEKRPFGNFSPSERGGGKCDVAMDGDVSLMHSKKGDELVSVEERKVAQQRAVAFSAKMLGAMGKSVEDGSRNMSQMNSIKALLGSRFKSLRLRKRLWNDVYKIQRCTERKIDGHTLLSTGDRNSFSMVVEVVRKHAVNDPKDRERIQSSGDLSVYGQKRNKGPNDKNKTDLSFPPPVSLPHLRKAVCSQSGHFDFEEDQHLVQFMADTVRERGQQLLARFDPESQFTIKWIRLQKRNTYVDRAREMLDDSDKALGQRCSCVPGYAKDGGNGNENRVACSNDLCENRHMKIECVPGKCGAGSYCLNQRMQTLSYARFKMVSFLGKGVGVVADEDIQVGDLIGEYQGEVIAMDEYKRRMQEYEGERHFYFMTLTSKLVIDASRKSQATRFLNHSCDPNAETQKWNADGEPRVGIFAKRPIVKGTEITFDYGARSLAKYSASCLCGAKNCRGILASQKSVDDEMKVSKSGSKAVPAKLEADAGDKAVPSPGHVSVHSDEDAKRLAVVKKRIEQGKKYIEEAEALSQKLSTAPGAHLANVDESRSEAKQKLKDWEESIALLEKTGAMKQKISLQSEVETRIPRIPRKEPSAGETQAIERKKGSWLSEEPKSSPPTTKVLKTSELSRASRDKPASIRRDRSGSRWALSLAKPQKVNKDSRASGKRAREENDLRASAKIPRQEFFPTTSKVKRKPLRPKFAKRKRTRVIDPDDSFGEYSTASEAVAVYDDLVMSPSQLPDGNGACSDDEFVAAPPVEETRSSPESRRWNDRAGRDRRPYDGHRTSHADYVRRHDRRYQAGDSRPVPTIPSRHAPDRNMHALGRSRAGAPPNTGIEHELGHSRDPSARRIARGRRNGETHREWTKDHASKEYYHHRQMEKERERPWANRKEESRPERRIYPRGDSSAVGEPANARMYGNSYYPPLRNRGDGRKSPRPYEQRGH